MIQNSELNKPIKKYSDTFAKLCSEMCEKETCKENIKHIERIISLHSKKEELKYVELGCGSGQLAEYLIKNHIQKFKEIVLIDNCDYMITATIKRLNILFENQEEYFNRIKIIKADVRYLNFIRDNYFDIVIASCIIHLVDDPFSLASDIKRFLDVDGLVLISFSGKLSENHFISILKRELDKYLPFNNFELFCFEFVEKNKLEQICHNEGFDIVETTTDVAIYNSAKNEILEMYKCYCQANGYHEQMGEEKFSQFLIHLENIVNYFIAKDISIVYPSNTFILKKQ